MSHRNFILALVFAAAMTAGTAHAQPTAHILSLDASRFPLVEATLAITDANGAPVGWPSRSDVRVLENGVMRNMVSSDCDDSYYRDDISIAMSFDISGSMQIMFLDRHAIDVALDWGHRLISSNAGAAVAIQACTSSAWLIQDYTKDPRRSHAAADRMVGGTSMGGNNFYAQLLDANAGLLRLASRGVGRRNAILFTDGVDNELTLGFVQQCIDSCRANDVTLYVLLCNVNVSTTWGISKSLDAIARASGGRVFENLETPQLAQAALEALHFELHGVQPCHITWMSGEDCTWDRHVAITIPGLNLTLDTNYLAPAIPVPSLLVRPSSIDFGAVRPGSFFDTTVSITALNQAVTVASIAVDNPAYSIVSGAAPPALTLMPGDTHRITLRFQPSDSSYQFTRIVVASTACLPAIGSAVGGFPGARAKTPEARLIRPNGGEIWSVGDAAAIEWSGVMDRTPVAIDYSTDSGAAWIRLADSATGLHWDWTVPPTPSMRCLARIRVRRPDTALVMRGFSEWSQAFYSADGSIVAAWGDDGWIRLFDAQSGRLLRVFPSHSDGTYTMPVPVNNAALILDGTAILIDGRYVYDIATGSFARALKQRASDVISVSRDGSRLIWADTQIHVYDIAADVEIGNAPAPASYDHLQLSRDGQVFIALASSGEVDYWSTAPPAKLRALANFGSASQPLPAICDISTDNARALAVERSGSWVRIWRTSDWALINRLHCNGTIASASFGPDGHTLVTTEVVQSPFDDPKGFVTIWDADAGVVLKTFPTVVPTFLYAQISPDGQRVLVSSGTDSSGDITEWFIDSLGAADMSDSLWAIVAPAPTSPDVDLGKVVVGTEKDSLVTAFVSNPGPGTLHIRSLSVMTPGSDFSALPSTSSFDVAPGAARPIEFSFTPSAMGLRSATISMTTPSGTFDRTIRGEGVAAQIDVQTPVIDFGAINIGDRHDTTVAVVVRNVGSLPVNISGVTFGSDASGVFGTVTAPPAALLPGDDYTATLRFSPQWIGRVSTLLTIAHDAPGSPSVVQVIGTGIGGRVYVPKDSGRTGDVLPLRLKIDGPTRYIADGGGTRFVATVTFNATLLWPEMSVAGPIRRMRRTATIRGTWDGAGDSLGAIPVTAMLGDTSATDIAITEFHWLGTNDSVLEVDVATDDGTFHLTNICREGSERLISTTTALSMRVVGPNPSNGQTVVEIGVDEQGVVDLSVVDLLGRQVAQGMHALVRPGTYAVPIDFSGQPAGMYRLVLHTPTQTISTPIIHQP